MNESVAWQLFAEHELFSCEGDDGNWDYSSSELDTEISQLRLIILIVID